MSVEALPPPGEREAPDNPRRWSRAVDPSIITPIAAVLLAVIVGSVVIIVSSFIATGELDLTLPLRAYWSLIQGSLGNVNAIVNSIVQAAPLALGGLAVGVGFKAGLFNIGVQGQFLLGALAAAATGAILHTEPFFVSMPASIIAGILVGGLYGAIPGALKAATGAHEVVTTIMLNYVAASILGYLVIGPLAAPGYSFARTGDIGSAALPILFGRNLHAGIFVAFALVPVMWWLLYRTTLGFQIRTVGANPSAARYAGMLPGRTIVLTMALSGSLGGLAGGLEILGISGFISTGYGTSIGFDAITVALLGRSHPFGILLASLLFGVLRAGAGLMQIQAGIPPEIVDVIQALILLFLTAQILIRRLFRIRRSSGLADDLQTVTKSYAGRIA